MDHTRVKATELAVELLRNAVPEVMLREALTAAPSDVAARGTVGFEKRSDDLALRLGVLVRKTALEIEKHIR